MPDQEDYINLGKVVFDDNNLSVPTFCHFVDRFWLLLENSPFKNL